MIRRTLLRKSLIAALALMMAAAPSIAHAGYGTLRTSPFQFTNWMATTLRNVSVTHHYGTSSETFDVGDICYGQTYRNFAPVHFYTGGSVYAGDYWTISGWCEWNGYTEFGQSLYHYDLHADDAGVMVSIDMRYGDLSYLTDSHFKMDIYSNNGSATDIPLYIFCN